MPNKPNVKRLSDLFYRQGRVIPDDASLNDSLWARENAIRDLTYRPDSMRHIFVERPDWVMEKFPEEAMREYKRKYHDRLRGTMLYNYF